MPPLCSIPIACVGNLEIISRWCGYFRRRIFVKTLLVAIPKHVRGAFISHRCAGARNEPAFQEYFSLYERKEVCSQI
jgi:hypothetical protein